MISGNLFSLLLQVSVYAQQTESYWLISLLEMALAKKEKGVAGQMTQQAGRRMCLWKALPDLKKKIYYSTYYSTRTMLGYGLCIHVFCIKEKNKKLVFEFSRWIFWKRPQDKRLLKATKKYRPKANLRANWRPIQIELISRWSSFRNVHLCEKNVTFKFKFDRFYIMIEEVKISY